METTILNGWKEIAQYLGRGVRTVQRWEALGLPIRRPHVKNRSAVVAFRNELEEWLKTKPAHELTDGAPESPQNSQTAFRHRILVVDDNEGLLVARAALLVGEQYDVRTARDGFEALAAMRGAVPDLLVTDLRMPNMSGFELLTVVRRRFPGMGVIATSGEFSPAGQSELCCDYFLDNSSVPEKLLQTVRSLLLKSPLRAPLAKADSAPVWIPRSNTGYVVLTCIDCLRPFSVAVRQIELGRPATDHCIHCGIEVRYWIDESLMQEAIALGPKLLTGTEN
jgi:CheY-like chemotaxis protein